MLEAAIDAIRSGVNQYPPGPGNPVLRAAIAALEPARGGERRTQFGFEGGA